MLEFSRDFLNQNSNRFLNQNKLKYILNQNFSRIVKLERQKHVKYTKYLGKIAKIPELIKFICKKYFLTGKKLILFLPNYSLYYPQDIQFSTMLCIMNNSVKIKFNFFPVRKKNHHKNLIISGIFVSINDVILYLLYQCTEKIR